MFSRIGAKAYKADLGNISALCKSLANPEQKFLSIHVAGTNGKGSVSHMLSAILQKNGYRCGLFTSPHLYDFRERIRINGEMISKDFVVQFVDKIKAQSESIQPSFFEITFAMAADYFASQHVDVAVIETGMGGRLDSTNIITPILSVITNIGLDHVEFLGDTIEKIAAEKAGIIKEKVPVVIGETQRETRHIFLKKSKECNAPIFFTDQNFKIISSEIKNELLEVIVLEKEKKEKEIYHLDLIADYQKKNLLTVLQSKEILKEHFQIKENLVSDALSNVMHLTGFAGRWQQVSKDPDIILDVAHNVDGIRQLVHQLQSTTYSHLHIVFGMVSDKDVETVLQLLPKEARYYFTKADTPRALDEKILLQKAEKSAFEGKSFPSVMEAVHAAQNAASGNDLILVCGSVFVVAEVNIQSLKKS